MKQSPSPVRPSLIPRSFVVIWIILVAALLAWKGSVYTEAVQVRRLLGMQAPVSAYFWWIGAACIIALVIVWSISLLSQKSRGNVTSTIRKTTVPEVENVS